MNSLTHALRFARFVLVAALLSQAPRSHANSAIAVNERTGSYEWVASGAPLIDLESTAVHWLYRRSGVTADPFPASSRRGWCAVAINARKKMIGYALGYSSQRAATQAALQRAGGETAGARLDFVVNELGNRQLNAFRSRTWR